MSKVKNIYRTYQNDKYIDELSTYDDDIFNVAKKDPQELDELIKLFENEDEEFDRGFLADILARLGCKTILPFLLEQLKEEDLDLRYDAAYNLIHLQDERGAEVFRYFARNPQERIPDIAGIRDDLQTINNEMARKLCLELCTKIMYPLQEDVIN